MEKFKEVLGKLLLQLNLAQGGLFMFAVGLIPAHQRDFGPTDGCAAQLPVYEAIGFLTFVFPLTVIASIMLASYVDCRVPGPDAGGGEHAVNAKELRRMAMLAVIIAAAASGMALAITMYVLQVKASTIDCWSPKFRLLVFGTLSFYSSVYAFFYYRIAKIVLFCEIN